MNLKSILFVKIFFQKFISNDRSKITILKFLSAVINYAPKL